LHGTEQDEFESSYDSLIQEHNVARELARLNMPVSHFSTFIVTGNLLNWFRFLHLRMAPTAQMEIRVFAGAIEKIASQYFPQSFEAFNDYWVDAISLSGEEMRVLKDLLRAKLSLEDVAAALPTPGPKFTKREMEEFKAKLAGLGIE
jgi:thymidylate synthase (FAD)